MTPNHIKREVVIEAPVDVVWAVVTEPQHISRWFSDSVELDLRPGGAAALRWEGSGTVQARGERVEPPNLFAFRWVIGTGGEVLTEDNSTLVEFRLTPERGAARLTVVESGFSALMAPEDEKARQFEDHVGGWKKELGELADYVSERNRP